MNKDLLAICSALVSLPSDTPGNKFAAGQCFWHGSDYSDMFLGKV